MKISSSYFGNVHVCSHWVIVNSFPEPGKVQEMMEMNHQEKWEYSDDATVKSKGADQKQFSSLERGILLTPKKFLL